MLACARIGAVHSVVFGGFAANELATRIDDAKPVADRLRLLRHRGRARSSPTSRCSTARSRRPRTSRGTRIILQRPQAQAELIAGRDLDWAEAMQARTRSTACRSRPPTRSTSSTPRARPASPRAWCATMAATPRRCSGPCATSTASQPGEVYWAASDVGWVVGHSYICLRAAAERQHHHRLRGQAGRHARPGRLLAGDRRSTRWRSCSPHPPPSARSRRRTRKARFIGKLRPLVPAHPVPRRRALRSRHAALGRGAAGRAGDRPLVADRDRLGDRRQPDGHRAAAGAARLAHRADARLRRADPGRGGRGAAGRPDGRDLHPAADAAGLPADAVARRRALPPGLSQPLPRLVPDRRRRLQGRGRLPLHHEPHRRRHQRRRPPALDRRRWRRCWPRTRTSPSAR